MPRRARASRLDAQPIVETIANLQSRVDKRFGEQSERFKGKPRGLAIVCRELHELADKAAGQIEALGRTNWFLLLLPVALTGVIAYLTYLMATGIDESLARFDQTLAADVRKLVEVLKEIKRDIAIPVVLTVPLPLVIGMFAFIWTLESRWKRRRALGFLHEIRSIIHVIDMHQLPKEPRRQSDGSDPDFIGGEDLVYYFDYCVEMLSLSGKVAALYAETSDDPVVIEAVSDLVEITATFSDKIWQKLTIVERQLGEVAGHPARHPI